MESLYVTYHIQSSSSDIRARAEAVALEQSVELPRPAVRDPYVEEHIIGKIETIDALADGVFKVVIRFNPETTGYEPAQFLNVLFGNTSLQSDVLLVDIDLPSSLLAAFVGPQFGMAGLRALVGAETRPLTCSALKPMGLPLPQLAEFCRIFAVAGIDLIKDDHGLAEQSFAPFAERVRLCQEAIEAASQETGRRAVYVPNLLGTPNALRRQVDICRTLGVRCVMLEPMLVGLPAYYELIADGLGLPVLAHPAFAGALRMAPELLFGKLFRLFGSDAVIYPNYGGRFTYSKQVCADLAGNLRQPWGELRPAFPVPAGGMQVDRVDEMVQFYGKDTILLIGGSLYMAGDALMERSRTFAENARKVA